MSTFDEEVYMRRLFSMTAAICSAAGLETQARKLLQAKISRGNAYKCANRVYGAVEITIRMQFGRTNSNPYSKAAAALEATSLIRAAMDHLQCNGTTDPSWLEMLALRVELLRIRACPTLT